MSLAVNLPIIIRYIVLDHLQKLLFIPVPNYQAFEVEPPNYGVEVKEGCN